MQSNRNGFTIINKRPSINIAEWREKYPHYCAIIERDKEKEGYGWIRYRQARPYIYSLSFLQEITDYDENLCCDPHDCYEIIPKDFVWQEKWKTPNPERLREILIAMNS